MIERAAGALGWIVHCAGAKQRDSFLQRARVISAAREQLDQMRIEVAPPRRRSGWIDPRRENRERLRIAAAVEGFPFVVDRLIPVHRLRELQDQALTVPP